jgi:hypothetical protein
MNFFPFIYSFIYFFQGLHQALLREYDNKFDVNAFAIEDDLGDEYNW